MSSRSCPDWPLLMEVAPELQFMHYTVAEAKLPSDVLNTRPLDEVLERRFGR